MTADLVYLANFLIPEKFTLISTKIKPNFPSKNSFL